MDPFPLHVGRSNGVTVKTQVPKLGNVIQSVYRYKNRHINWLAHLIIFHVINPITPRRYGEVCLPVGWLGIIRSRPSYGIYGEEKFGSMVSGFFRTPLVD